MFAATPRRNSSRHDRDDDRKPGDGEDRGERRDGLIGHTELTGERLPTPTAENDAEWYTDHERDQRSHRRLPADRGRYLTTPETEHLEDRELAAPAPRRREERMGERPHRQDREEPGDDGGKSSDPAEVDQIGRLPR